MALEIERKFLVTSDAFKEMAVSSVKIVQSYLSSDPAHTVRVRVKGEQGFITVKGKNRGSVRNEWEYEIPVEDAIEMTALSPLTVSKIRWVVPYGGYEWEVDEFQGRYAGLIVAEVELPDENATLNLPPFVGEEVTGNPAYYNSNMAPGNGPAIH